MRKAGLLLTGACVVSLAFGPAAWAQTAAGAGGPENTPAACSDGVDNDGNGCIDCYDPGCRQFCPPPPQYAPPPPQYAPPPQYPPPQYAPPPQYPPPQYPPQYPPPQYYAPPPPPMYAPAPYVPPPPRAPSTGLGLLITGIIFVPLGLGMLGGGVDLLGSNTSCNDAFGSSTGCGNLAGGAVLVTLGSVFSIMGLIFIPAGAVQLAKYSKWKREHQPMVKVSPSLTGLKMTF